MFWFSVLGFSLCILRFLVNNPERPLGEKRIGVFATVVPSGLHGSLAKRPSASIVFCDGNARAGTAEIKIRDTGENTADSGCGKGYIFPAAHNRPGAGVA